MGLTTKLTNIRSDMHDMMRNYNFKKANQSREQKVKLLSETAKCRGQLEVCQIDFNRVIRTQSKNIEEGKRIGADTLIQEQMLWDAALGYLLVKEAIYSLSTVNNNDSVEHAYDVLDAAVDHLQGKHGGKFKTPVFHPVKRKDYAFLSSNDIVKRKEDILDGIFEKLKMNGDIELCLKEMSQSKNAVHREVLAKQSADSEQPSAMNVDELYRDALDNLPDDDTVKDEDFEIDMMNIHSPQ